MIKCADTSSYVCTLLTFLSNFKINRKKTLFTFCLQRNRSQLVFINLSLISKLFNLLISTMVYECTLCGNAYNYKSETENHIKIVHQTNTKWQCNHCGQYFTGKFALEKHMKICCTQSEVKRKRKRHAVQIRKNVNLSKYIREATKKERKNWKCTNCGKFFKSMLNLNNHTNICGIPRETYHQMNDMTKHNVQYVDKSTQTECAVIDFEFSDDSDSDNVAAFLRNTNENI